MSEKNVPSLSANDSKLFDAAIEFKVGDEVFYASMLTDRDFGDLDQWIKSKYINMAYEAADLAVEEASNDRERSSALNRRKEMIETALLSATSIGWGSDEGWNFMMTSEGMIRLGFQFCRKRHPTLKFKEFDKEARKDVDKTVVEIDKIYGRFYPKRVKEENTGGTPDGNSKSG